MRITEAIAELEEILLSEGDLEVVSMVLTPDGFTPDLDHQFEVLRIAVNEGDEPRKFAAFVDKYALEETQSQ